MIVNDFVMMAVFITIPLIGVVVIFIVVKEDEADHKHQTILHENKTDTEILEP